MIQTFKFKPRFEPGNNHATLGTVPAGLVLRSEPICEDGELLWLIEIDTDPARQEPREIYSGPRAPA